jgi:hypothetical protein
VVPPLHLTKKFQNLFLSVEEIVFLSVEEIVLMNEMFLDNFQNVSSRFGHFAGVPPLFTPG